MPAINMNAHRKLTQAELCAEAAERFGPDPKTWAFQCPRCGDIATVGDFPKGDEARLGQECVGRTRGALKGEPTTDGGKSIAERGCDWAAYGLFRGPWEIVMPDGRSAWGFPLAPAPAKTYTLDEAHAHPGGIAALTGGAVTGPYFSVEGDDEDDEMEA